MLEFSGEQIEPASSLFPNRTGYVCNLIKTGEHMIQVLDLEPIVRLVFAGK